MNLKAKASATIQASVFPPPAHLIEDENSKNESRKSKENPSQPLSQLPG